MKLHDIFNSRPAVGLGLTFSRLVQPRVGYPLARFFSDIVAGNRRSLFVKAVRANHWVIHNERVTKRELDRLTRETFRSAGRSLYEFWHYFRDPRSVVDMVEFEPSFVECLKRTRNAKEGTLIVAPHISNFDLVGRALVLNGMDLHILSYPQPPGGYKWQNLLRQLPGLTITPMSIQALRQASQTLRAGRTVLTGVDRPLPDGPDAKYRPCFFGRRAAMPVFHIRLALKHNLPITVLGGCRTASGRYRVWASDPIPMRRDDDLVKETVQNAETILGVISEFIRRSPEQWAMFYPVWPEVLESGIP
jgi:lauroyl/myristoyl acyltransferase